MKSQLISVWSRLREKLLMNDGIARRNRRQSQTVKSANQIEMLEQRDLLTSGLPTGSPTPSPPVHTFYIDSINGSSTGNGTQAHPWQTLQKVISAGLINGQDSTKGVVHAGDLIYLMNGNEGSVKIDGQTGPFNNKNFITIQAYPGTHPVLTSLSVKNSSNWAFRGLTFTAPASVQQYDITAQFTKSSNIVFDHNTISSQSSPSNWTPQNWINSAPYRAIDFSGTNATITNNTISAVRFGISIDGNNINLSGNTIDDFADDAIDFTSSNTLIQHNTITNHYGQVPDGNHNDGIQGWTNVGGNNSNVTIDSNVVIASTGTDPGVPAVPTGVGQDDLQGISIFDGIWTNVTVTNNVVEAASSHGIAMYGLSNSIIANNTVVKELSDPTINTWILVAPNRATGAPIQNVIVRNNIANMFNMTTVGVTDDHNISLSRSNYWGGASTDKVVLDPTKVFVSYDPTHGKYNLHLLAGSPAIAAGTSLSAPTTDVAGLARVSSKIDIGAYAYVPPKK